MILNGGITSFTVIVGRSCMSLAGIVAWVILCVSVLPILYITFFGNTRTRFNSPYAYVSVIK